VFQHFTASSSCSSTLIRFLAAIRKQPAVMDRPLLCVLNKKGSSFFLFQSLQNSEYFLLGARKRYLPSYSSFELSTAI
jgi:hypothetical protein